MKNIFFSAILIAGLVPLISGCGNEDTSPGSHTHGPDPLSFTVWTEKAELFVEFPPLVVGEVRRFAAHFTEMENFKAIKEGKVAVRLRESKDRLARGTVLEPSSPGIFRPFLTPDKEGTYHLDFYLTTPGFSDTITLPNIVVYQTEGDAIKANPPAPEGDDISFLKEQAWKIDFAIAQVKRHSIREVIHTSGEIQPVKGEQKIVAAKSSGIVFFKSAKLQEGRDVRAGEVLFTISSKGLTQSNIEEKYKVASARFDKAKADFERAEGLLSQQAFSQKEYEVRKMEYEIAQAEFNTLTENYKNGGQTLTAPITGIVKNVLVTNGQFVKEGDPLVEVTRNRRLLLEAEVAQNYLPKLRSLYSANFKTAYQEEVQSLADYNGKLISYGKMMEEGSGFIPVVFELDNLGELIPGAFVEMFLLTNPIENALTIPKAALMQDYNSKYVYVQTEGESFKKREVQLGIDDGMQIQVLSGLNEGDWVVTKGAYQIKMASMSTTIPAHGHEH
jgi:RND family efflux transporter MFP subunit